MLLPLYGFLEGDALGLVILADDSETVQALADKLRQAASVRVPTRGAALVRYRGSVVPGAVTLVKAGFEALLRFDVVQVGDR